MLPDGRLVAIKRSQQGSNQGGLEFKTEIELLSRVHHKNLVELVGFCCEKGELILVYEFMSNGTIRETLSGMLLTKVPLFKNLFVISPIYLFIYFVCKFQYCILLLQEGVAYNWTGPGDLG